MSIVIVLVHLLWCNLLQTKYQQCYKKEDPTCECFFWLFKNGEMFHCNTYQQESSSRNDTVCFFKQDDETLFGIIKLFVLKAIPVAIISVLHPQQESLLAQARQPCKESLCVHKDINFYRNSLYLFHLWFQLKSAGKVL